MTTLQTFSVITPHWHQAHKLAPVLVRTNWRCSGCGHRLRVNDVPPMPTRKMMPWRWIPELLDRERAKGQFAWLE